MFNLILPVVLAQVISNPLPKRAVTKEEVMAIFADLPAVEAGKFVTMKGHWEKKKDAAEIADAISQVMPSKEWAARAAVYAVFESGLEKSIKGDIDDKGVAHAFGTFQLQGVPIYVAIDPLRSAQVWLGFALGNKGFCPMNKPEEAYAALGSGSCDKGRRLARRREAFVSRALEALEATERAAEEAEETTLLEKRRR
jgi:hypothetical protein